MMFVNKEEVEASAGQKFIEPSAGVPIKKRPFNVNGPSFIQSDTHFSDKLSFTSKHVTPKSLLDFAPSSPCSSNDNNKLDSNTDPNNNNDKNAVRVVRHEKAGNNCSTDLSLTGNCNSGSSKIQDMESLNCSGRRAALDLNVDLNVAIETWDSTADFAVGNNGVARNKPVEEQIAKCNGNIPKVSANNLSFSAVGNRCERSGLGEVTLDLQLKLPPRPELRMKNFDLVWSSDLSLSLSGKDMDTNNNNNAPKSDSVKSQVVETSKGNSSGSNANVSPAGQKEVTVKKELAEPNLNQKDAQENGSETQNLGSSNLVKKEPIDSQVPLGGKLLENSSNNGIDLNQNASGISNNPVVTKRVPVGSAVQSPVTKSSTSVLPAGSFVAPVTKSNASGPIGSLVVQPAITKSNTSVPAGRSKVQPAITKSNTSAPAGGSVVQSAVTKSITSGPAGGSVVQPAITKSNTTLPVGSLVAQTSLKESNVAPTLPLVGTIEDVKPVISSIPITFPATDVNIASKQTLPMVSEGMSQGSADMDCSEENHILPKLSATTVDKSKETLVNSSSSILSKTPKLEPEVTECAAQNTMKLRDEKRTVVDAGISKTLMPSNIPSSNDRNIENSCDNNGLGEEDKNEMPSNSNCTHLHQLNILSLSNKTKQRLEMDGIGLGSKSRSPSLSGKRDSSTSRRDNNSTSDREAGLERESCLERENYMEREINSSSRRQFVGEEGSNSHQFQFQRRFKRNGFAFDRPAFERKKSRVSQWDEGLINLPNRGRSQRWEPRRYINKFDSDMIEDHNEDTGFRPGSNNRILPNIRYNNNKNNTNRFNNNRNKSRGGFRFTRQNNNNNNDHADMSFPDESNRTGPRPCLSRFQSRRRLADVSPREADEMDSPVFDHPNNNNNNNHYNNSNSNKRAVDHTVLCRRDRSFSPQPRRGSCQWTSPVETLTGRNEMLTTRVVRSPPVPNRRPFYSNNKDCTNRRHLSNNNRPLHRNNNNTRRFVGPASGQHFESPMHFDGDAHYHHVRYCSDDGDDVAFSDGGAPPVRGRNRQNNNNNMRGQGSGDQEEFRYNNRGGPPHSWRDGNNNSNGNNNNNVNSNNGDKLRRRRY